MQISITRTVTDDQGRIWVSFESPLGQGQGLWKEDMSPDVGSVCHVEIDVPGIFQWGFDLTPAEAELYALQADGELVYLCVQVESLSDDGCLSVYLADDIVLLDTLGVPDSVHGFVRVRAPRIELYDAHIW